MESFKQIADFNAQKVNYMFNYLKSLQIYDYKGYIKIDELLRPLLLKVKQHDEYIYLTDKNGRVINKNMKKIKEIKEVFKLHDDGTSSVYFSDLKNSLKLLYEDITDDNIWEISDWYT